VDDDGFCHPRAGESVQNVGQGCERGDSGHGDGDLDYRIECHCSTSCKKLFVSAKSRCGVGLGRVRW